MAAGLDGDAKIAAGCEDGSVWVLDGDGRTLGLHRAESEIHTLTAHEESRLLIGCSDGTLSLLGV